MINRLPTSTIQNQSPYEKLFAQAPNYTFLRVFGCECWPNLRPYNSHKLQPRSTQCVFLGYSLLHKGYKCLHLPSSRVYFSGDVLFNENIFPFAKHCSTNFRSMSPLDLTSFQVQSTIGLHAKAPISIGLKSFNSTSLGFSAQALSPQAQAQFVYPTSALLPQTETFLPHIPTPSSPLRNYSTDAV